jgi:HD-GYP domain-containing protein (c-di-GMP phosphodiesterase class II)
MEKKMVLLPVIQDAILQHRERADGKGFPKALPEHKISPEARLLRLADRLEELTARRPDHMPLDPNQALERMRSEGAVSLELLNQVKALVS